MKEKGNPFMYTSFQDSQGGVTILEIDRKCGHRVSLTYGSREAAEREIEMNAESECAWCRYGIPYPEKN